MKFPSGDNRGAVSIRRLSLALAMVALVPLLLDGSAPSWWSQRGVLVEHATADEYAPVNQGQLKNIAKAAVAEMDAKLTDGAGNELHALISSWAFANAATNDYAPVNLGQVKNMARPFFDRLIAAGVVDHYPWQRSLDSPDDFAIANIGQVKNLFSFHVPVANLIQEPLGDRIAAGRYSANLALQTHAVWIWGDNFSSGSDFERNHPRRINELSSISSVSAGSRHLVALRSDGSVWTWGENALGQLGNGTLVNHSTPAAIPNVANIMSVKAGGLHTLALQQDGTVMAWGDNYYGQLGTGDTTGSAIPKSVVGLDNIRKIAAGYQRSVALKNDGTVWSWGYDHYSGGDIFNPSPVAVPDLIDVVDVATGYEHTIALKADGTVWAWGSNYANQIGNASSTGKFHEIPTQVPNLSNINKIASTYEHSLALASDGTVWAWGNNFAGQLGDGTNQTRQMPVLVRGLSDVIAIATASSHSLAMKADGTIWTWGDGATGTLPGADLHVPQLVGLGVLDGNQNGMDDRWEMQFFNNLEQSAEADFDGDGISNRHESLRGTDPTDYFNGLSPVIAITSGNNQVGDPGKFLPKAFKVRVQSLDGHVLVNAPVTFSIEDGLGALATTFGGSAEHILFLRTDSNGEAATYHLLPITAGISTRTVVSAGTSTTLAATTFRGIVRFSLPSPTPSPTPSDPNASPTPTPSPTATPIPPYRYTVLDLGKDLYPLRVNNKGWILLVGEADGQWGYFRWKGGVLERLTYSGSPYSFEAIDMNDEGVVAGTFWSDARWVNNAENERAAGLTWAADNPQAVKTSAPVAVRTWAFRLLGTVRHAFFKAINNQNQIFGGVRTGGGYGSGFGAFDIMNAYHWASGAATQLSFGTATFVENQTDPSKAFVVSGETDTVLRANGDGNYIGSKLKLLSVGIPPLLNGTRSGMIDGMAVDFDPVDINDGGIVVGNRPSSGPMVIKTLVQAPLSPPPDELLPGIFPVAINTHTKPAATPSAQPSSSTSPSVSPSPTATPIPMPQILGWAGNAVALLERQPDGKTWHPFGLEELIPNMEGWKYLEPYDMNDNGAIVGRAWYKDPSKPTAPGEYRAFLLVPVELMVDGNRDGEMGFGDPAVRDADQTSEEKRYRFWLNDDDDGAAGDPGDHVPVSNPDYMDGVIRSVRDLEDFARLHVNVAGFEAELESGSIKAAFEWKHVSDNPRIKLYRALSAGTDYLTKQSAGISATLSPFRETLGEVTKDGRLFVSSDFWVSKSHVANIPTTLPVARFMFEGSGEGKGQLILSFWQAGHKIGETPGVWLELKSIKKLYQHRTLGGPDPWGEIEFEPAQDERKEAIVFVHGWRLSPADTANFAETMYKRLWWRGFKGRYMAVRWDTYYNSSDHGWVPYAGEAIDAYLSKYNDSEHNAWMAGQVLKNVVNSDLPADYSKNVIAHSLGNVVAGSALQQGMTVDAYALLNAALPAACYDDGSNLKQAPSTTTAAGLTVRLWDQDTPDDDPDTATRALAYRGRLKNVSGNLISFYLPADYATSYAWELNNALTKPPAAPFAGPFLYKREFASGHKLIKGVENVKTGEPSVEHYITDPNEAQAYACRTWGKAVGAEGRIRGKLSAEGVNLGTPAFGGTKGLDTEHSAEFDRDIQQLVDFYNALLDQLRISRIQ